MNGPALLVTGFGPFPGVPRNLSGWLAQTIARSRDAGAAAAVLPVCWHGAWAVLEPLLEAERPRVILSFGVSSEARGFCLEQCAYNVAAAVSDMQGRPPAGGRLSENGPDMREATLPLGEIAATLASAGLPVSTSNDPGRYLCNATLYRTLEWAEATGSATAGFVHIPATIGENAPAEPDLSQSDLLTGARLIAETALRAAQPRPRIS